MTVGSLSCYASLEVLFNYSKRLKDIQTLQLRVGLIEAEYGKDVITKASQEMETNMQNLSQKPEYLSTFEKDFPYASKNPVNYMWALGGLFLQYRFNDE